MLEQRSITSTLSAVTLLIFLNTIEASKVNFSPQGLAKITNTLPTNEANLDNDSLMTIAQRGGAEMSVQDKALAGAAAMLVFDTIFRKTFNKYGIKFPAQLGGCIFLFIALVVSDLVMPGLGETVFKALTPGTNLLTKWLPVFFVPGLAMLPLAPSIGTALDHILVLSVVVLGFYYSSSTVAYAVLSMRKSAISQEATPAPPPAKKVDTPTKPKKPFLDSTLSTLLKISSISGVVSIAATRSNYKHAASLQTIFHFSATLAAYVWSALLPVGFTKFVHPLVTGTVLTWVLMQFTALATNDTFKNVLQSYRVGSLHWSEGGAGDHLLNLLGPSVVSFAVAVYSRKELLKENLLVVITAMLISAGGGLFGTAAFVRAINLGGKNGALVRLSVLSRNITTALAIAVTTILEGNISIASSVVVLTGIFAATFGRTILDTFGIKDPVTRGLAIGSAGQGLGVASMAPEPDAFPFAAVSMVLTAVCATTLVSVPSIKDAIVKVATGA